MAQKFVQTQAVALYSGLSAAATSMVITPYPRDIQTNTKLTFADFGTSPSLTIDPKIPGYEEICTFTGITDNGDNTATLTGLTRNLIGQDPYITSGTGKTHGASAVVVFTDNPQMYARLASKENANTFTQQNIFQGYAPQTDTDPVADNDLTRKSYVLSLVLGTLTTINVIVPGNAGENVSAGNLVYFDDTDNEWKKCDADTPATVQNVLLGIAQGSGTNGNPITDGVLLQGVDDNQSGLSIGDLYYASNTAGGISTTPGTTEVTIGIGKTATTLYFAPRFNQQLTEDQQDALDNALGGALTAANPVESQGDTSVTSAASKLVRGNASGKIDDSWLPGTSLGSIITGENITAGLPVYINAGDSSLYKAHGFKEINTASLTLASTVTNYKIAKLSDTQFMSLYDNGSATLSIRVYTTATGATVASQTVSTAYDSGSSTTTIPSATVCRLTDTTFIVIYAHTTDNNLYFRTGSISGSTITMDTETAYPGSPTYCWGFDSTPGLTDGKVVFAYQDSTADLGSSATVVPVLSYLTVATNSVTVTTSISGASIAPSSYFPTPRWSVVAFTNSIAYALFCCMDGGGQNVMKYNWINLNDSTTGADKTVNNLETQTGAGVATGYSASIPSFVGHDGKCYFGWSTYDGGTGIDITTKSVLEINQIGCRIFYQTTAIKLAGDTTVAALPMVGNECGVIVFGLSDTQSGYYPIQTIYIQRGKIYEFFNLITLTAGATVPLKQMWFSNLKDEIVIGLDGSYIKTWRLPTPVDGMIIATTVAPAVAAVYNASVTTSGLTANAQYFLKDTYTNTGDMAFTGVIPVGKALSTTVINLVK